MLESIMISHCIDREPACSDFLWQDTGWIVDFGAVRLRLTNLLLGQDDWSFLLTIERLHLVWSHTCHQHCIQQLLNLIVGNNIIAQAVIRFGRPALGGCRNKRAVLADQ